MRRTSPSFQRGRTFRSNGESTNVQNGAVYWSTIAFDAAVKVVAMTNDAVISVKIRIDATRHPHAAFAYDARCRHANGRKSIPPINER